MSGDKSRALEVLSERIARLEELDGLLSRRAKSFESASLALAQLKHQSKYASLDSSAFKRLPAYLHVDADLELTRNTSDERLLVDDGGEEGEGMTWEEERALEIVDSKIAPRVMNSVEEMMKVSEERMRLMAEVLEEIRKDSSQQRPEQFRYRSVGEGLPDSSQMFNVLSNSNDSLVKLQRLYREYLEDCLAVAKVLRTHAPSLK